MQFTEFAYKRFEIAGQKYVNPDGTNQAMSRDNVLDILEELADAYIIARLGTMRGISICPKIASRLEDLGEEILDEYRYIPEGYKVESVERIVRPV